MRICHECGAKNSDGARFCQHCGRKLDTDGDRMPAEQTAPRRKSAPQGIGRLSLLQMIALGEAVCLAVVIAAAAVCLAVLAAVLLRRRKNLRGTAGTMMLCLALLLPLAGCSGNKGVYTVNGNVRTLPDSTCLLLYRLTDDGYLSAVDTAYSLSGRFTLSCPLDSAAEMTLLSRDLNSMLLTLYAEPGKTASVSGNDNFLFTWNVRSNVPLQKEAERYMACLSTRRPYAGRLPR